MVVAFLCKEISMSHSVLPSCHDSLEDFTHITAAADCITRAIARGVYEATALPFASAQPSWRDRFG